MIYIIFMETDLVKYLYFVNNCDNCDNCVNCMQDYYATYISKQALNLTNLF